MDRTALQQDGNRGQSGATRRRAPGCRGGRSLHTEHGTSSHYDADDPGHEPALHGCRPPPTEANRKLFSAYTQGVEAALKGGFEVQNAIFAAGQSVFDASTNSSRNVVQQWTEIAREAQQATLDMWQAGVGAGDKMLGSAASGEMAGQEDRGRRR
jgi:hypothetical protein